MNKGFLPSASRIIAPSSRAAGLPSGNCMLSFARADWWPAVTLPSTQSAAFRISSERFTCAAFSTSGIVRSILRRLSSEFEIEPDERGERRTRNNVAGMRLIEVIAIRQVVEIALQRNAFGEWMTRHRVEDPVARDLFDEPCRWIERHCRARGTAVDKLRARACGETPRQVVGRPCVECVLRNVRELSADGRREKLRCDHFAVEIGIAREKLPAAGDSACDCYLESVDALSSGKHDKQRIRR